MRRLLAFALDWLVVALWGGVLFGAGHALLCPLRKLGDARIAWETDPRWSFPRMAATGSSSGTRSFEMV